MRGTKPRPTHLRLVDGNPGRRPINKAEPKPAPALPAAPDFLDAMGQAKWREMAAELHKLGILSTIDIDSLCAYCQAYSRWRCAEAALADMAKRSPAGALLVKTVSGNLIHNPLVGIANKAMGTMIRIAAEFGMTPSSRSRVHTSQPGDDPMSRLLRPPDSV